MDWEKKLLSTSTDHWIVDQVVILDWYDGPRSGLCVLANPPAEFIFEFVDEEPNPDGLDLRIVQLKELPIGSVNSFAAELEHLTNGPMTKPVWSPCWVFPTHDAQDRAEKLLESLQGLSRRTDLLISTIDMVKFQNCWPAKAAVETSR